MNTQNRNLIIHIGSPKAGSTALQNFLISNRLALNKQNFDYQDTETDKEDWRIHRGLTGGDIWNPIYPKIDGSLELNPGQFAMFERVLALSAVQLKNHKTVILSNEFLYFIARSSRYWKLLTKFQKDKGVEVRIFLYLRNPFNFLYSWYSESIKRGFTALEFSAFSAQPNHIFDSVYSDLPHLIALAGKNSINLEIFGPKEIGRDIANHFSQAIGFNNTDCSMRSAANTGLNPIEIEFFRGVHRVSSEMGLKLCNERTDVYLSNLNPSNLSLTFRHRLSQASFNLMSEKLQGLKLELSHLHPSLKDLEYGIPEGFTSGQIDSQMDEAFSVAYEIRLMLGRSYVGGYLKN